MQFQADILGIPVDVPEISETTALGVAYMAAYGSGLFKDLDEIEANWKLKKRYYPKMSEKEREKKMRMWHRQSPERRNGSRKKRQMDRN